MMTCVLCHPYFPSDPSHPQRPGHEVSQRLLFDALVFLTTVNKEPIDVKKLAKAVGLPDDELEAMIDAPRLAVTDAADDDKAREEYEAHVTRELSVLMAEQMLNYNFESVYDCVRKLAAGEQAEGGGGWRW